MADDVVVDNATNGDYTVSTDEGAGGHVQRVKLAYAADGSETHVDADADGLLVNLGANNDVVVSDGGGSLTVDGTVAVSGTVAVTDNSGSLTVDGTVTANLAAGTNNIGDVDVLTLPALPAGTNAIGKLAANSGVDIGDVDVTSVSGNVTVVQGTATNLKVDASGVAVPITDNSGTLTVDAPVGTPVYVRLSDGSTAIATLPVSLASVPSHAVTNAGVFAVQVDGSSLTALQKIDDPVLVDDAGFTPATSSVSMSGFQADEASTDSVDEGDAGAARMTLDRKQIVVNQPHSAGGCSIFRSLDIDETEEDVKTSAGTVYGWAITNTATSTRFIKFYNATAANTTVGSTTPVITFGIPGNTSDDVGANMLGGVGINFDTAICVAATTGAADNDSGAPSTGDVLINVFYK